MNSSAKPQSIVARRAAAILADPRWAAVVARDAGADGQFYYSVSTTGVYCRPSCASRRALPENVQFHASILDAENAGFRACKRCRPNQPDLSQQHADIVTRACRLIEAADEVPSLDQLAQQVGVSSITSIVCLKTPPDLRQNNMRQRIARSVCVARSVMAAR